MSGSLAKRVGASGGGALSVTVNDVTRTRSGFASEGTVTTVQLPNTRVTGGAPTYSYLWERVSGSLELTCSNPLIADPTWTASVSDAGPEVADWRLTITDSALNTAEDTATISLYWFNLT